ncbi:class D sortase [Neobacillus sp. PS3-40]|jgi:sortase A|uniref:class D sortase n=1 Tax=Neobacillus sp. PS3-40 TaxID=3070679 RepID=UPI0027E05E42|nr:class D sortase [Neobacillus sp. PS3-40]WML45589.1 class D sortase [Neobacillus sp. PS3-40]
MKVKSWFPLTIIVVGLLLLGTGIWQLTNVKIQTYETLKEAKDMVMENQTLPTKNTKKKNDHLGKIDTIGLLVIPKIKAELAIVEGTDPDDLEKGVGHYKGSFLPGEHGQIVLSGHRDTVFRHLGELKIGDPLVLKVPTGVHTYKITHTKIVSSKDTNIITLQNKVEELILTTCYPFSYIGNAPKRYIIYAEPN